jgi:uncharacterized membrane protein
VALALFVSFMTGYITPTTIPTTEMLSRGSPSLLDAGVAFFAGVIGAYATARRGIPAALAGVAIAAALMPPLCTVGLGMAFGNTDLALGAMILFLTNIGSMSLAGWSVFFWLGMRPQEDETNPIKVLQRRRYTSFAAVSILMAPIIYMLFTLGQQSQDARIVEDELSAFFLQSEVTEVEIHPEENPPRIVVVIRMGRQPRTSEVREAEDKLEDRFGYDLDLELIVQRRVRPIQPLETDDD